MFVPCARPRPERRDHFKHNQYELSNMEEDKTNEIKECVTAGLPAIFDSIETTYSSIADIAEKLDKVIELLTAINNHPRTNSKKEKTEANIVKVYKGLWEKHGSEPFSRYVCLYGPEIDEILATKTGGQIDVSSLSKFVSCMYRAGCAVKQGKNVVKLVEPNAVNCESLKVLW